MKPSTFDLEAAYSACRRLARRHYENFPVASVLLPPPLRHPVSVIYRFARSADDFADEGDLPPGRRLELLDDYRQELRRLEAGIAPGSALFAELGRIVREYRLPLQLFHDLLDAFAQDVVKNRYADFAELMDYCRRSANPVGRLLLHLFNAACIRYHWPRIPEDTATGATRMRRLLIPLSCILFIAATFVPGKLPAQTPVPANAPYKNTTMPVEKRVADLLSRMTLEEKATMLSGSGYEVVCASTAAEALELFADESIRLVITDVFMPDGSGFELLDLADRLMYRVKQEGKNLVRVETADTLRAAAA